MRTCVNLHSAEIKFAAGTASFLREGLDFPHKKPSRNRAHATSAQDKLNLGYPSPDIPYRGSEPRWRRPPFGGVRISTPTRRDPLVVYPSK
jgi:hypothetical protein